MGGMGGDGCWWYSRPGMGFGVSAYEGPILPSTLHRPAR